MSGILRLESLTKGNTLKQGDKTPLKYRLFDADGEKLNIAGKSAQVRLVYPDFLTIGYEKDGITVAQDDTVTFTIDGVIPSRIYHVEIIVDNKFVFPSRSDEAKFTVDKSSLGTEANIIEIVGVDQIVNTVLGRVDADINQAVTDINATNDAIQQAEQERVQGYQEIQQIIEDGTLNTVPADGSLTTSKYADASVSKEKTNFIKSSSNLLDVKQNTLNKIITADGNIDDNLSYDISEFYELKPGGTYTFFQVSHVLQYGEDDNFINRTTVPIGESRTLTFPVNRKKIRLNILKSYNNPQFNEGSTLLPYEDYYVQLDEGIAVSDNSIRDNSITNDKLTPKSVTIDKTTFLHPTQNLADVNKVRNDGYYAMQGVWIDNDLFSSIIIDIPSGGDYITNIGDIGGRFLEVAYWDYDGRVVVSNIGANGWSGSLTIPENVRKVAINYRQDADIQKMMFVQGNTLPVEYIPYGFTLDENILIGHEQPQKEPSVVTQGKGILIFGDSITETATMNEDGTNYKEMFTTWVTHAKDVLKPITIKNYARSGSAYRDRDYPGDRRKSLSQQVMMALGNNEEADIIVVSLGTNDGLTKVGDYDIAMSKSSKSELDLTNTAEAGRWAYWTLRENYPEATIYCALPIQRADIEPPVELIETIEKIARRYNAIIINATDESGIVKDFEVWQGQGRYLADGLHPHEEGKKMMSRLYSRVILNTYTPNN